MTTQDERYRRRVETVLEIERARRDARRLLQLEDRGPTVPPTIETLRERLARPRPPTRCRIDGWQPCDSRVMLAAQFKAGKTTLVGNLIRSLVDGDAFLGRDAVNPIYGTLALIDTEMAAAQLDDWLRDQQILQDERVIVIPLRGRVSTTLDLLDTHARHALAAQLRDLDVSYVVLDCLRPVLDALGLDEHREAGRFLVAFDALLAEAGISDAFVVHHMGHNGERSRGDSRIRDWPDVEWRLVRQDDEPASPRFIAAYGRDVDQSESQLTYEPDTRRLCIAGGSRRDAKAEAALDAVLEVLTTAPGAMSGRAIKQALHESDHTRAMIEAALSLGCRTGRLTDELGPKRAHLYRPSVPVSRSVPPVSQDAASECPVPSIRRDTRTLIPSDVSVRPGTTPRFDPTTAFLRGPDR